MAEANLRRLTHVVLAKSELLSFPEVCKELGIPNDMELLERDMSEYSEVCRDMLRLSLIKTKLYEAEDALDHLYKRRHDLFTKAARPRVVGPIGDEPAVESMRPRELSESGAKRGGGRSFVLKVVMVLGLLPFVFVALML